MRGAPIDETGKRYGTYTVTGLHGISPHNGSRLWTLRCDCGRVRVAMGSRMRSGNLERCKMCKPKVKVDLTGKVYGDLTVIRLLSPEEKVALTTGLRRRNGGIWECRCVCGGTRLVGSADLGGNFNQVRNCGCRKVELVRPRRWNKVIGEYARSAAVRGHVWGITREQFIDIASRPCSYCGLPPSNRSNQLARKLDPAFRYSGIDRVDSSLGYVPGNVVPCCQDCNISKNDRSLAEFRAWAIRVVKHMQEAGV